MFTFAYSLTLKLNFMRYDKVEYCLPNWALCALVNGDYSGLEDEDISKIEHFTQAVCNQWGNAHFSVNEVNDRGFCHRNDIDKLGSDCSTGIILVEKPKIKTVKAGTLDLSRFPNVSITGRARSVYGLYAYLIKQGKYIYNVSSEREIYRNIQE